MVNWLKEREKKGRGLPGDECHLRRKKGLFLSAKSKKTLKTEKEGEKSTNGLDPKAGGKGKTEN